jgi:peptide/nickel transport system substrate-binding protein
LENDDVYKFERNVNYFENELPYVDRLLINVIKDPESRIAAFKVKLIDVKEKEDLSIDQMNTETGLSEVNSISINEQGLGMSLSLNLRRYPFNNLKAREATFLAMDPWSAAKVVWSDTAYVSLGFPSIQMDWLLKNEELRKFFNQPDRARDVMRSEYSQSLIPVTISVGDFGDMYLRHAKYISDELKYIGFDPVIQIVDRRTYGEDVWLKGNYAIALGPVPPVNSLNRYLIPLLHSEGLWNSTSHKDKYLDGLLEAQSRELDPTSRKELLLEIQRVVLRKAVLYMPATKVTVWMWLPRVQNFSPMFEGYGYSHWAELWLQDRN